MMIVGGGENQIAQLDIRLLDELGVDARTIVEVSLLHERHGHQLFHIATSGAQSFVLKLFPQTEPSAEVQAYALLRDLDVPTLPVHGATSHALLLEDLSTSRHWRLATVEDVARAEIGEALAQWYRCLHHAGKRYVEQTARLPLFLHREFDDLTEEAVHQVALMLDLANNPVWDFAASHLETLKAALCALPATITYNDFHFTNLAVSRDHPTRAILYDYHLLGIGPCVSDYRNVLFSLTGEANEAFRTAYGPIDERDVALDAPLATLHAFTVASRLPYLPEWALELKADVDSGKLATELEKALAASSAQSHKP